MPDYLIILLCIAACIFILVGLYGLFVLRRTSIAVKKIDYLVEDITYKSESIGPIIDSILKISAYVDVLDVVIKNNLTAIKKVIDSNSNSVKKFTTQLEKALKNNEK